MTLRDVGSEGQSFMYRVCAFPGFLAMNNMGMRLTVMSSLAQGRRTQQSKKDNIIGTSRGLLGHLTYTSYVYMVTYQGVRCEKKMHKASFSTCVCRTNSGVKWLWLPLLRRCLLPPWSTLPSSQLAIICVITARYSTYQSPEGTLGFGCWCQHWLQVDAVASSMFLYVQSWLKTL